MGRLVSVLKLLQTHRLGVKDASVTLSFDNSDKSKSPAAYKDSEVINVTRKVVVSKICELPDD